LADNFTTDAGTFAAKDILGILFAKNLLNDTAGADAMGLVDPTPAPNTMLGRLKTIADGVTALAGSVDGLEGLATSLNGFVDGLETLIGTSNTSLTAIAGYVDGLEALATSLNGYVDGLETLHGTTNSTLATIAGYVDGLETLIAATNAALTGSTPAGENYTGKIGGDVYSTSVTPAVSATPDYSAGDAVGAIMTFTGAVRTSGGAAILQAARIFSKVPNTVQFDLLLFNAAPTAPTDNVAFDLQSADYAKLIGVVPVTEWTSLGTTACVGQSVGRAQPVKPATGTSIFGVLVVRGTLNLAAVSDIVVTLDLIPG
jgi:hypothetical protein